jgi:hypothetical protein
MFRFCYDVEYGNYSKDALMLRANDSVTEKRCRGIEVTGPFGKGRLAGICLRIMISEPNC